MSFPLHSAIKAIKYVVALLQPHCQRIHIAGSISRLSDRVKDMEIVCEPTREKNTTDLFGNGPLVITPGFSTALASVTKNIIKGNVNGRMMQIVTNSKLCSGIILDLFMPAPQDYYRQLVIRTGSADYVHNIIAAAWKRLGWCGTVNMGLRKMIDCTAKKDLHNKTTWTCINPDGEIPPLWPGEVEFFQWLGLRWIQPKFREFKRVLDEAQ